MRRARPVILFFVFFLLAQTASQAALREEWKADKDNKKRKHLFYNGKKMVRSENDTNDDGKPDQFYTYLGVRNFVTREYDRNFDGKIDRRTYGQWDNNRTITIPNGTRMMKIPNPGYRTIWSESDDNFDGIIDVYTDKRKGIKTKAGQKMDLLPMPVPTDEASPEQPATKKGQGKSEAETRVDLLNDRYSAVS